jgi:hypothetical protein
MKKRIIPLVPKEERQQLNEGVNKPEAPDLTKIFNAVYPSSKANYMRVIPDSHFWTNLAQIKYSIEHELQRVKRESSDTIYVGEPLTKKYILIGLGNSIKNGYKLKPTFKEDIKIRDGKIPIFTSIEQMIEYVQSENFILEMFKNAKNGSLQSY